MKRNDIKIVVVSILILAIACSIGAGSVSALSADGESILSGLASAGSSVGINIGGIIDNYVSTTKQNATQSVPADENTQEALDRILETIGIGSDVLLITDLVSYLNRGGSFADWIYDNYGEDIDIPDSVRAMSTKELALYLMGTVLYPDQTKETEETTTKYIYSSDNQSAVDPTWEEDSITTQPSTQVSTDEKTTEMEGVYIIGDVDANGKVSAMDARLALRASASLDLLEGLAFEAADVNGDGRITANDARSILRYSARITSGF